MHNPLLANSLAPRPPRAGPCRSRAGFTLVELMVSMTILGILSILLMTMLNQVAGNWNLVQAQIDTRQNGRSILTMMASDVRGAALPRDLSNTGNLQFLIDPTILTSVTTYLNPHAFFWQAPIATNNTYGNMAEVGYFVRWDTTNSSNPRAILCRFFLNPTTLNTPAGSTGNNPNGSSAVAGYGNYLIYGSPNAWITSTILDSVAPGTNATTPPYTGWVADNVLGLWVRAVDAYGFPIVVTATGVQGSLYGGPLTTSNGTALTGTDYYAYDSRQGYFTNRTNTSTGTTIGIRKTAVADNASPNLMVLSNCNLPAYVDIAVMVIDARSALRITTSLNANSYAYNSTNPENYWAEINSYYNSLPTYIQREAKVYSTRVPLANAY